QDSCHWSCLGSFQTTAQHTNHLAFHEGLSADTGCVLTLLLDWKSCKPQFDGSKNRVGGPNAAVRQVEGTIRCESGLASCSVTITGKPHEPALLHLARPFATTPSGAVRLICGDYLDI